MRNSNIDLLRFILILFVVQHHMNPYDGVAVLYSVFNVYFIVWMFLLVSLYLLQNRGAVLGKVKWSRLIVPYLSWSIIYLCLRSFKGMLLGNGFSFEGWTLKVFLTGSASLHLYFIPLLLFFQLIACTLSSLFLGKFSKSALIINCGMLIAAFSISDVFDLESRVIGSRYGFFMDALFAVVCAQALVSLNANTDRGSSNLLKLMLVLFTVILLGVQANIDAQSVLLKVVIATVVLHAILQMPVSNKIGKFDWLFNASFGIFLIHHAIIESAEVLFAKLGIPLIPYNLAERILGACVVAAISYGLIYLIRRSKYLSFLLIGEKKVNKIR